LCCKQCANKATTTEQILLDEENTATTLKALLKTAKDAGLKVEVIQDADDSGQTQFGLESSDRRLTPNSLMTGDMNKLAKLKGLYDI